MLDLRDISIEDVKKVRYPFYVECRVCKRTLNGATESEVLKIAQKMYWQVSKTYHPRVLCFACIEIYNDLAGYSPKHIID